MHFIPGHPIAGTEHSGPEAGFAELFDGRWCILTPPQGADPAAVDKLAAFWQACGSHVEVMDAEHHDLVLAITSHVPHLIAYNIVNTARHLERVTDTEVIKFSAGGFRDFTRIAASDPVMWRDVFLNNKEAVLEMLGRFSEDLTALQRAIRFGDGDTLYKLFAEARASGAASSRRARTRPPPTSAGSTAPRKQSGRELGHEPAHDRGCGRSLMCGRRLRACPVGLLLCIYPRHRDHGSERAAARFVTGCRPRGQRASAPREWLGV